MPLRTSVVDQPKSSNDKDQFGIEKYENALIKFIEGADTPLTIALQGEWGSGKTSLMNALDSRLASPDGQFFRVWINTWQYSLSHTADEAICQILSGIIEQLTESIKSIDERKNFIIRNFKSFASVGVKGAKIGSQVLMNIAGSSLFGVKGAGNEIINAIMSSQETSGKASNSEVAELKNAIEHLIQDILNKSKKKGFLFFIDDLDRIDPPVAVQILELLKNIFDIKNCIFILAIDYDVVIKGLKPKFGELTDKNEREFRSFFDKIIQLPFSMPVAAYEIDRFLIDNLKNIGYISDADSKNQNILSTLSLFAKLSVGTNPRSLKRLTNILSLIQLIRNKPDTANVLDYEKIINFALVCMQISYPSVYNNLLLEPNFKEWDKNLKARLNLPDLSDEVKRKISSENELDEPWEQVLYLLCKKDPYLSERVYNISRMLNEIQKLIPETENLSDVIEEIIKLSAVTNIQASDIARSAPLQFHHSTWLKKLNEKLLYQLQAVFPKELQPISMPQKRIENRLHYIFSGGDFWIHLSSSSDKYLVNCAKGDWLYWGECSKNTFEEELALHGIKREEFEQIQKDFSSLTTKYNVLRIQATSFHHNGQKEKGN